MQAEAELQEQYFQPLVKKEEIEEKMRSIKEVKCRVVTCKTVSEVESDSRQLGHRLHRMIPGHPAQPRQSLAWP